MPLAMFASAVLLALASLAPLPAPAAPDLRNLRWVRASVSASTPETVTLQLRDREIVVIRNATTELFAADPSTALAAGAVVEVHYTETNGTRRAIFLIADPAAGELSRRPKTSLVGTVQRLKRSTVWLRSGGKERSLTVENKSRLMDRDGRVLATGSQEITKLLSQDLDLLVKYDSNSFMVDGVDLGGSDNIVEIRLLK